MPNRTPRHPCRRPSPSARRAAGALFVVAAAVAGCAAPKGDARADSGADAISQQALRSADSARAARERDSLAALAPPKDSMPNAKTGEGGVMPNAKPRTPRPEPMPNAATPPAAPLPAPNKKPPTRVVPDPVHAPRPPGDSAAAAAAAARARDSLHDLPSDYGAKRPERRRVPPPIKP